MSGRPIITSKTDTVLSDEEREASPDPSPDHSYGEMPELRSVTSIERRPTFKRQTYYGRKVLLYYYPTFESVAQSMAEKSDGRIKLKKIDWKYFKDGFPDLKVRGAFDVRWAHVCYLADLSNSSEIFQQFAVMCALPKFLAKSFKILVPYFPTGTMERVTQYGQIATAKSLARLLSAVPNCAGGPVQICVCDIHTLQNQFYFGDSLLVRLESCLPLLLTEIHRLEYGTSLASTEAFRRLRESYRMRDKSPDPRGGRTLTGTESTLSSVVQAAVASPTARALLTSATLATPEPSDSSIIREDESQPIKRGPIVVAFPDDGALKRFGYLFSKYPTVTCLKKRDGAMRIVVIKDGESHIRGAHVIIVDDLVQTGGTLANCARIIREKGAKSVNCYVTHAVFPEKSWQRFAEGGKDAGLFDTFYITDSIPSSAKAVEHIPPFHVLSVASCLKTVCIDDDSIATVEMA